MVKLRKIKDGISTFTVYYTNGKRKKHLTKKNGKHHGKLYGWFQSGKISFMATYQNDNQKGLEILFFKNKNDTRFYF